MESETFTMSKVGGRRETLRRVSIRLGSLIGMLVMAATLVCIVPIVVSAYHEIKTNATTDHAQKIISNQSREADVNKVTILLTRLDPVNDSVSLVVEGGRQCAASCAPYHDRLLFSSFEPDNPGGTPRTVPVDIPANGEQFQAKIDLVIRGNLMDYPFDRYPLQIGVAVERTEGGAKRYLDATDAAKSLDVTLDEGIPQIGMSRAALRDPSTLTPEHSSLRYALAFSTALDRPLYIRIFVILIVLLFTMATFYSVAHTSFDRLIVSTGSMILGLWGARSLLIGNLPPDVTLIDLVFSMIVVLILFSTTVHAVLHYRKLLRNDGDKT
ncbi:hypothetical protein WS90_11790 [Burkholderia cepacia]|uniref:Uncharacterized protein n=1 Tax=Burkholderia cepacia TaxID=292 RepID=A0A103ZQK4_BURCE|nr:hypothetical protein [Burkholderia cepacia]KVK84278.1 hypothetical protein WS90_11790 [Burkholderia cepacia]